MAPSKYTLKSVDVVLSWVLELASAVVGLVLLQQSGISSFSEGVDLFVQPRAETFAARLYLAGFLAWIGFIVLLHVAHHGLFFFWISDVVVVADNDQSLPAITGARVGLQALAWAFAHRILVSDFNESVAFFVGFFALSALDAAYTQQNGGSSLWDRVFSTSVSSSSRTPAKPALSKLIVALVILLAALILIAPMVAPHDNVETSEAKNETTATDLVDHDEHTPIVSTESPTSNSNNKDDVLPENQNPPALAAQQENCQCASDELVKQAQKAHSDAILRLRQVEGEKAKSNDCTSEASRVTALEKEKLEAAKTLSTLQEDISKHLSDFQQLQNDRDGLQLKWTASSTALADATTALAVAQEESKTNHEQYNRAAEQVDALLKVIASKDQELAELSSEIGRLKHIDPIQLFVQAATAFYEDNIQSYFECDCVHEYWAIIVTKLDPLVAPLLSHPLIQQHVAPQFTSAYNFLDQHLFSKHPVLIRTALVGVILFFILSILRRLFSKSKPVEKALIVPQQKQEQVIVQKQAKVEEQVKVDPEHVKVEEQVKLQEQVKDQAISVSTPQRATPVQGATPQRTTPVHNGGQASAKRNAKK